MAIGNLKIEDYVPAVSNNQGIYSEYDIETTGTITASNVTSITTNLSLTGTLNADGATTLGSTLAVTGATTLGAATSITTGDLTITNGNIIVSANAKGLSFTGTGSNGGVLTNLKNAAASALSGTQKDIEINIGGTPYYFTVYPTKA